MKIEIIPAIDILGGKCVRLTRGNYAAVREYSSWPEQIAEFFYSKGFKRMHVVDLDGARAGRPINLEVIKRIARVAPDLSLQVGGGIRRREDVERLLNAGARKVIMGSTAVKEPELFQRLVRVYGSRIMAAVDIKEGRAAIEGWARKSGLAARDLMNALQNWGVREVIVTDVGRDGMLAGVEAEFYQSLRRDFPGLSIIASGGVAGRKDLERLEKAGIGGVILGKALYEGRIELEALSLEE